MANFNKGDFVVIDFEVLNEIKQDRKADYFSGYYGNLDDIIKLLSTIVLQVDLVSSYNQDVINDSKVLCNYRLRGQNYNMSISIDPKILKEAVLRLPKEQTFSVGSYVKLNIDYINGFVKHKELTMADPFKDIHNFYNTLGIGKKGSRDSVKKIDEAIRYELANSEFIVSKVYRRKNSQYIYYKFMVPKERKRTSYLYKGMRKTILPVLPGTCLSSSRLFEVPVTDQFRITDCVKLDDYEYANLQTGYHMNRPKHNMFYLSDIYLHRERKTINDRKDEFGRTLTKYKYTDVIYYDISYFGEHGIIKSRRYDGSIFTKLDKVNPVSLTADFGSSDRLKRGIKSYQDDLRFLKYQEWALEKVMIDIEKAVRRNYSTTDISTLPFESTGKPGTKKFKESINLMVKDKIENHVGDWIAASDAKVHGSFKNLTTSFYYLFYDRINTLMKELTVRSVNDHNNIYGDYARIILRDKK